MMTLAVLATIVLIEAIYRIQGSTLYQRPVATLIVALVFCSFITGVEWMLYLVLGEAAMHTRYFWRALMAITIVFGIIFALVMEYTNNDRLNAVDGAVHSVALVGPALLIQVFQVP